MIVIYGTLMQVLVEAMANSVTPALYTHLLGLQQRLAREIATVVSLHLALEVL
jgi:hypothetical protein